ncbi:unnamed protein product, partial [Brenthis ino]
MSVKKFIALTFIFALVGVEAQYYGRMHNLNNVHKDPYICTCEDLLSLISLSRSLEEKEKIPTDSSHHTPYPSNFEELIMKLVNALVYITTQAAQNKCYCSHSSSPDYPPSHGSHGKTGSPTMSHKPVDSKSDSGLIDIDILNPDKKDNVLDVDVGRTQLLGIGLGGRDSTTQGGASKGGYYDSSNSGGGINLDLLNANKKNNVADLDIGKQNVLGIGLGGGGKD